jgi:peptidyl-prolyl cis-trans isomerase SurA
VKNQTAVLFTYTGGKVTTGEFAKHLAGMMRKQKPEPIDGYVKRMYDGFVAQKLMGYEESILEKKYDDFRLLIKEYRDGILLFELTDQMVWSKGMKDSTGLAQFFERNQQDYQWEDRVDAEIYWCANLDVAKKVQDMLQAGASLDSIRKTMNASSSLNVTLEVGKFEKSKQVWLFAKGGKGVTDVQELTSQNKIGVARINDVIPSSAKQLSEVRGTVIARYQDYLEQNWITELKARYKVVVNENVLYSIK